jgi:hypothetical protein
LLVRDQERRNAGLNRLACAIECSLAPPNRLVQRDAEIGTVLDQFSVLVCDGRIARTRPSCQSNFNSDSQACARPVEGLVDASFATVDDHDIRTVACDKTP